MGVVDLYPRDAAQERFALQFLMVVGTTLAGLYANAWVGFGVMCFWGGLIFLHFNVVPKVAGAKLTEKEKLEAHFAKWLQGQGDANHRALLKEIQLLQERVKKVETKK